MKIGQQQRRQSSSWLQKNLEWFAVLVIAFAVGLIIGSQEWRLAAGDLWSIPARIARSVSSSEELPTLAVDMNFTSYDDILDQREEALREGVFLASGRDFVTATVRLDNAVTPIRIRLLEGPADHLGDEEKWGFEVHTRQNQRLFDMQRFYLLDPSINNWLNQWVFVQALEDEGILAARYRFVQLVLNGDHRGIYALEEGFGAELPMSQGRSAGVIVGFDADLLWESIAHFHGEARTAYADPIANLSANDFQYFEVDVSHADDEDSSLAGQRTQALNLLRALQTGELKASEVFDAEQYGRFLALVDLWGGIQNTSLVNLHYYYDASAARLEPIGFNSNALGADGRLSLTAAHDDPLIQAVYAQEALRLSQPAYLAQIRESLEPEFQRLQRTVDVEGGDIEPPWSKLQDRQRQIRHSLDPVQPIFAHLGSPDLSMSGTLRVNVGNVLNLPVEVIGFDIDGAIFLPADRQYLQNESDGLLISDAKGVVLRAFEVTPAPIVHYVHFDLPLAEIHRLDNELDFMQEPEIRVVTRIFGLEATRSTLAQEGSPDILATGANQ